MIVEVFKTNVSDPALAARLLDELNAAMLLQRASFDLDDDDRVLRIEAKELCIERVVSMLARKGLVCSLLE